MFIGHYAPALLLATDRRSPRLGPLFVAAQLVDLAFFTFVLLGIEHMRMVPGITTMNAMDLYDMRFTHSLVGTAAFALIFAGIWRGRGGTWIAATIGGVVVASHWLLDLIVHSPDLTIFGSGYRYGLGLWNLPQVEMPLELAITAIALTWFYSETRANGVAGRVSFWALAGVMLVFQAINWLTPQPATIVDPVPAAASMLALFAYAVMTALAWWTGATRERNAGPVALDV